MKRIPIAHEYPRRLCERCGIRKLSLYESELKATGRPARTLVKLEPGREPPTHPVCHICLRLCAPGRSLRGRALAFGADLSGSAGGRGRFCRFSASWLQTTMRRKGYESSGAD
jgi:hypothetical protein